MAERYFAYDVQGKSPRRVLFTANGVTEQPHFSKLRLEGQSA